MWFQVWAKQAANQKQAKKTQPTIPLIRCVKLLTESRLRLMGSDTMTQPTRPSPPSTGAVRAADRICDLLEDCGSSETTHSTIGATPFQEEVAHIIDRETGMAELLEALKVARKWIGRVPQEYSASESISLDAAQEQVEQAIAKCESGTGGEQGGSDELSRRPWELPWSQQDQ